MEIYDDASSFGKTVSFISAIIFTLFALLIIFIGISTYRNPKPGTSPGVLIISGIVIIIFVWVMYWIVSSSKFISAAVGTQEAYNLVKGL